MFNLMLEMLANLITYMHIEEAGSILAYGSTIQWHKNVVILVNMYNHKADKFH